jgi:large subunit ribosomal protein L21
MKSCECVVDNLGPFGQILPSMYAVIETGGKQVRVQAGDIIQVEKLTGDVGAKIVFDKVLFISIPSEANSEVTLGKPYISNAAVEAEIIAQGRGDKVTITKMKRRKQYRRTQGHRQEQTQLLVTSLSNGGSKSAAISDSDKKVKMTKFFTLLKPKGPASTTKTLGSGKKRTAAKKEASIAAKKAGTPKAAAKRAAGAAKPAAKPAAKKTTDKSTVAKK